MRFGFLFRRLPCIINMDPFLQRASLANEKIQVLRGHIETLKKNALASAIREKEKKLELENKELQEKVEDLKRRLMDAEIMNGKLQVALPSANAAVKAETVNEKPAAVNNQQPEKKDNAEPEKKKQKTEKAKKKATPQKPKGSEGAPVDVSRLDFRVARIVKAEKHPEADTLYIEDIETGEEKNRTVLSGLVKFIPLEEMQNRMVVLMMNLKPVKMRGIFSHAMVMCASSPEKIEILAPPPGSVPGDRITFEGYPGEPDTQLNPKKKVWEQVQPDLLTNADRVACYKGVPFTVKGKGVCTAPTMANSAIK